MAKNKKSNQSRNPIKSKGKRASRGYPRYDMETSLDVAKIAYHKAGPECSDEYLPQFLGYKSANNGAYLARVGAAKVFGFIDSTRGSGMFKVTDRALTIMEPVRPADAKQEKVNAFLSVPLFNSLYAELKNSPMPSDGGIKNLLKQKFGIMDAKVNVAFRVFMDSARFAGFFDVAENRLMKPLIRDDDTASSNGEDEEEREQDHIDTSSQSVAQRQGKQIHEAISGLLKVLPAPGEPWSREKKESFMTALKSTLDLIYPDEKGGGE